RFVRRNRTGVAAASAIALSLIGGAIASLVNLERARREARRAEASLATLWDSFDGAFVRGADARVVDLVRSGVDLVERRTDLDPETRAQILVVLANALSRCGDFERQRSTAAKTAALLEELVGRGDARTCRARVLEAEAAFELGDARAAHAAFDDALPRYRRHLAERAPDAQARYSAFGHLAWLCGEAQVAAEFLDDALGSGLIAAGSYEAIHGAIWRAWALVSLDRFPEARAIAEDLARTSIPLEGAAAELGIRILELRARVAQQRGDSKEALELERKARDLWIDRDGEKGIAAVRADAAIARLLLPMDPPAATVEARRAAAVARERLPRAAPTRLAAESILGECLAKTGEADEGIALIREVLAVGEESETADVLAAISARTALADALLQAKRPGEAEQEIRRALAAAAPVYRANDRRLAPMTLVLAQTLQQQSRSAEADPAFVEAARRFRESYPETPWRAARVEVYHSRALRDLARYDEAERELLAALPVLTEAFGPTGVRTCEALEGLANLYATWGKPELEEKHRALLREAKSVKSRPTK
ncbi:MAG TPA: tetratricopeptide repeat protein, partial [Planctomycetota bacterium]|nr:tetratricopeptide repeat protein [Planctomycetota bacterium]